MGCASQVLQYIFRVCVPWVLILLELALRPARWRYQNMRSPSNGCWVRFLVLRSVRHIAVVDGVGLKMNAHSRQRTGNFGGAVGV